MNSQPVDPRQLLGRISRLERAQRRGQRLLLASLGCLALVFFVAAKPRVYTAQKFELVSPTGDLRAELSASAQGVSRLVFFDAKQKTRLNLSVQKNGHAALVIYDSKAKARAALSTRDDESPTWVLYDQNGQARATMALHKDGRPILFFSDEKGKLISLLPHPGSR